MKVPVFKHTIGLISSALQDEKLSLQTIASLVKYDPGLFYSFLDRLAASSAKSEVTTVSQSVSLLGSNAIEQEIGKQDSFLEDGNSLQLWCFAVLAGEAAGLINVKASVAESEEAFFCALLTPLGMLLMLRNNPDYGKLIPLLLKLSIEDRVFLEDRLFKQNHISALDKLPHLPRLYKEVLKLIKMERFPSALKAEGPEPARLSAAYTSAQLFHLATAAEYTAQAILFPSVVLAMENLKQVGKRFFHISESGTEEFLSDIIETFEGICNDFGVSEICSRLLSEAGEMRETEIKFMTTSAPLSRTLDELFADDQKESNILMKGEADVGKRLLAFALHYHPLNPRRTKPFLSFHCDTVDRETLEEELFGSGGGYWGTERHKGAFDMANGGTIMLKNVDRMPRALQDRLADVISKADYYRTRKIQGNFADVLFILTSRRDLESEAAQGNFSPLLLRALKPVVITIPPLRERRKDISLIANGIINKYGLPLTDNVVILGLQEYFDNYEFRENLTDLKRLLFYAAAKHMLKSQVLHNSPQTGNNG